MSLELCVRLWRELSCRPPPNSQPSHPTAQSNRVRLMSPVSQLMKTDKNMQMQSQSHTVSHNYKSDCILMNAQFCSICQYSIYHKSSNWCLSYILAIDFSILGLPTPRSITRHFPTFKSLSPPCQSLNFWYKVYKTYIWHSVRMSAEGCPEACPKIWRFTGWRKKYFFLLPSERGDP